MDGWMDGMEKMEWGFFGKGGDFLMDNRDELRLKIFILL